MSTSDAILTKITEYRQRIESVAPGSLPWLSAHYVYRSLIIRLYLLYNYEYYRMRKAR